MYRTAEHCQAAVAATSSIENARSVNIGPDLLPFSRAVPDLPGFVMRNATTLSCCRCHGPDMVFRLATAHARRPHRNGDLRGTASPGQQEEAGATRPSSNFTTFGTVADNQANDPRFVMLNFRLSF